MKGLEELRNPKEQNVLLDTFTYRGKQVDIIAKELKALEIIKQYPYLIKTILDTVIVYGKNNVENYDLLEEVLK